MMAIYHGSCHCGAVKFTANVDLDHSARCNCSICRRRGAIMTSCDKNDLTIKVGQDFLSEYRFNTNAAAHYFCKKCGIYTFHKMRKDPEKYAINVGCIDDIDLLTLQPILIEGANIYTIAAGAAGRGDRA